MSVENTDLERRVLAHEHILQVLIAHMAEAEPSVLARLRDVFSEQHVLGSHEQDYTDTAGYAEQFIHEVMRLGRQGAWKRLTWDRPTAGPLDRGTIEGEQPALPGVSNVELADAHPKR